MNLDILNKNISYCYFYYFYVNIYQDLLLNIYDLYNKINLNHFNDYFLMKTLEKCYYYYLLIIYKYLFLKYLQSFQYFFIYF